MYIRPLYDTSFSSSLGAKRCVHLLAAPRPAHPSPSLAPSSARAGALHHSTGEQRDDCVLLVPSTVQQGNLCVLKVGVGGGGGEMSMYLFFQAFLSV